MDIALSETVSGELRLGDKAYATLEELIVTGQLAPGSLWSEAALSEKTGIGRTPVREALQRLSADHLVLLMRRYGIKITEIDVPKQLLVLETRRELERLVSVCAARRASDEERKLILDQARALKSVGRKKDVIGYLRHHFAAKKYAAACSRNPFAARALSPLHALSRRFYFFHRESFGNLPELGELHANLAEAIGMGKADDAANASDRMMDYAFAFTREIFDR
ncbi:MAG: GntR family transcriptional regulator [Rhodomicrobium sp.]